MVMADKEEGHTAGKMTNLENRSKLLRNLKLSRVAFGFLLITAIVWVGVECSQSGPNLLNIVQVGLPKVDLGPLRTYANLVSSDIDLTCLSRSQQYKFRKKNSHFPLSEGLTRALTKYTEQYSHCALSEDMHEVKGGCQYVVYYEGYEGVGNRLLSLVTAFLYSLITNRTLVLDRRRGHLPQLLCEPFRNSSWLLPAHFGETIFQQAVTLENATSQLFANVDVVHVEIRHKQTLGDKKFFCAESQQALKNVTWLIWESNQYYVPRLFMIPDFWAILHPLFPDPSLVFTQLSRFLCLPRNPIWEIIEHIQESELAASRIQVGIQVRRHGVPDNANFSAPVYNMIMRCLVEHQVLPKLQMSQGIESKGGQSHARDTDPRGNPKLVVLVTSLQSFYYDKMLESYKKLETEDGSMVKFHMVSQEGTEQYSYDQAAKALVEIWLLSFSDKLATSSWSTFGYVAQGLGGILPYILNIRGENPEEASLPPCSIAQSREPCLHYPYVDPIACTKEQVNSDHSDWVARHVTRCQDETRGIQLY